MNACLDKKYLLSSASAPGSLSRCGSQSSLGSAKFNPYSSGSETDSMDSMVEIKSIESDSGVVLRRPDRALNRGLSHRYYVWRYFGSSSDGFLRRKSIGMLGNLATLRESRESFGAESLSSTRRNSVISQASSDRRSSITSSKSSGLSRKISFKSLTTRKSKEEAEDQSSSDMKSGMRREASVRLVVIALKSLNLFKAFFWLVPCYCCVLGRFCEDFSEKRRLFSIRGREGSSSSLLAEDSPSLSRKSPSLSRKSRGGSYILHMEPSVRGSITSVSLAFDPECTVH